MYRKYDMAAVQPETGRGLGVRQMRYHDLLKSDSRVTILALSWRDIKSPTAGGAEVHTHEMLKRIDRAFYRVIHIAARYGGEKESELIDGVQYLRKGNPASVIWYAFSYYQRNRKKIDLVIDQCNTHRFFTPLWVPRKKRIFYIHQLTREIWEINLKFPWSKIGKWMENGLLKLNRRDFVITVSESTKAELTALGYHADKITIIPNGISFVPWQKEQWKAKEQVPAFVYAGRYAAYKGIDIAVESIGILKRRGISAKLWVLGKADREYIKTHLLPVCRTYGIKMGKRDSASEVIIWGYVSEQEKLELLSRAKALVFPSVREGWGIPITEAGAVGTPSVVFDSPGVRDAVDWGNAGYLCGCNSESLAEEMERVLQDEVLYERKRERAYAFSCRFLWDRNEEKIRKFLKQIGN